MNDNNVTSAIREYECKIVKYFQLVKKTFLPITCMYYTQNVRKICAFVQYES